MFADASKAFLEQVEQTVKLIRSKGVGVFFCTQLPTDLPNDVLSQLGARIQHALRAFTPDDQKALSKTVRTYPKTDVYDLESASDVAGYRRGRRHRAVREGRAHARRMDAHARSPVADGRYRQLTRSPLRRKPVRCRTKYGQTIEQQPEPEAQSPRRRPRAPEPDYPPLPTDFDMPPMPAPAEPKGPPCGRKC